MIKGHFYLFIPRFNCIVDPDPVGIEILMSRLVRIPGLKFIPIKSGLMTIHRGAPRKKAPMRSLFLLRSTEIRQMVSAVIL